ncbi:Lactonase, 7-bladed beta-propeller-domain-containing protein [Dichotomocladium elegans]|nr:Lactonase, 7-bladed beta-propeller-domain-containing protein [Dichotomocladium elegans]
MSLYVSGYTDQGGQGIYHYEFDSSDGSLSNGKLAAEAVQPSYFVLNEAHNTLYATIEVGDYHNQSSGAVQVFRRNPRDGSLASISSYATGGAAPCHGNAIDKRSRYFYVANYNGGSVASFPIMKDGNLDELVYLDQHPGPGTLGVPDRQEASHSHSFDTIGKDLALSCDLGEDKVYVYRRDKNGSLHKIGDYTFRPGTGPRHVAISDDERKVYVVSELSLEVFVFDFSRDGTLALIDTVDLRPEGNSSAFATGAEIMLTPNGRFLYVSIREIDLVARFAVDNQTGKLSLLGHTSSGGSHPRFFTIDPSGKYMLLGNMLSDTINVFAIDQETGDLTPIHTISHPQPTCIQFWK